MISMASIVHCQFGAHRLGLQVAGKLRLQVAGEVGTAALVCAKSCRVSMLCCIITAIAFSSITDPV